MLSPFKVMGSTHRLLSGVSVCHASCLARIIHPGFRSLLFLGSLIPRGGEERLFRRGCQVQFLLARAAFVKHAVIKSQNQTLRFLNGMLENYLQANKSCVQTVFKSLPDFGRMVLLSGNHFHCERFFWTSSSATRCGPLLIPRTRSKAHRLNLTPDGCLFAKYGRRGRHINILF